jgi:diaminopimelate decarboxylase
MTLTHDPADGSLRIEQIKLAALAKKYGTPLYVYSYERLIDNARRIREAFAEIDPLIAFSMKSNSNAAILRALVGEGLGLDIVSGGELARGLAAGADPAKIIFAGVGKTREEIAAALKAGIRAFNVESEPEAEAIGAVAAAMKRRAPIAIRVNPDVDAATHHYITTGKKENKFGIPLD